MDLADLGFEMVERDTQRTWKRVVGRQQGRPRRPKDPQIELRAEEGDLQARSGRAAVEQVDLAVASCAAFIDTFHEAMKARFPKESIVGIAPCVGILGCRMVSAARLRIPQRPSR